MHKFGKKVPHLRCDSHTSFKVKRSKVRVGGSQGHIVSAEPGGHTACLNNYESKKVQKTSFFGEKRRKPSFFEERCLLRV